MGEMVIVAARPSHGKSAFALHALDSSARRGIPTAIVSEEMSAMMLGKRTVQYASSIAEYQWQEKMEYVENELESISRRGNPATFWNGARPRSGRWSS